VTRLRGDYRSWLFLRISYCKIQKDRHRCFITFLLSDAYEYRDYDGVCNVYEWVESCMGEEWPAEKGLNLILDSAIKANRLKTQEKLEKRRNQS